MSQNLPKGSLRDFLSLRHPNHFVLAGANDRNVIIITYRFLAAPAMGQLWGKKKIENSSLFFFLALRARFARELADVFVKNEKKNIITSVYRLHLTPFFAFFRHCGAWSKASTEGELASVIFYQNNNNNGHNQNGGILVLGTSEQGLELGRGKQIPLVPEVLQFLS